MEPTAATNWAPGLAVLGAALASGIGYLLLAGNKAEASRAKPVDDLEARYQSLIAEMKEHAQNKHLVEPEQWATQRAALEKKAAQVLKERDQQKHETLKASARAERMAAAPKGLPKPMRVVLFFATVVGLFAFLGYLMKQNTTARTEGMGVTGGGAPMEAGPAAPSPVDDPKFLAMAGRLRENPDDVDALADVSIYMLRFQAFDESRGFVIHATELDPFNVKTRVARTVLEAVDNDPRSAADELRRLALTYPEAHDASMFEGLIAVDQSDSSRAIEALERYQKTAPTSEVPPFVQMQLNALKTSKPPK